MATIAFTQMPPPMTIKASDPIPADTEFGFRAGANAGGQGGVLVVRRLPRNTLVNLGALPAFWDAYALLEASDFLRALAYDLNPSLAPAAPVSTERTTPGPQALQVLEYLRRHESITQLVATEEIGTTRLAARIRELRVAGHKISTVFKRSDRGKTYAAYRLVKEAKAA